MFIAVDRREAGSSVGNSGGKHRWKVSGGRNRRESGGVAAKGAPSVGLVLPRCAGAPDRILPHRSRHGSAGSFIGPAHAPARFWGRRCGPFFGPKPKLRAGRVLEGVLRPWRCSYRHAVPRPATLISPLHGMTQHRNPKTHTGLSATSVTIPPHHTSVTIVFM
jgi:hypothetical protein